MVKLWDARKAQTALIAALTFYIISSPITYTITQGIFGRWFLVADHTGAPTGQGLLLHTAVFGLVTYWMMVVY